MQHVRSFAGLGLSSKAPQPIYVHKYGGSSLATPELIGKVADAIARAHRKQARLCVVVSAMGKTTDSLVRLASALTDAPAPRELDVLLSAGERTSRALMAMALMARGVPAVSMSGPECGIRTEGPHTDSRIVGIDTRAVLAALDRGQVVVVAGFQGAREDGVLTTLGRGGSDTTAVALAAALGAERCDIYSDVDGVYSADPRLCSGAVRLDRIGYDTMEELARQGAKVLHERAVGHARVSNLLVRACSTFGGPAHTVVGPNDAHSRPGRFGVLGVTGRKSLVRLSLKAPLGVGDLALGDDVPVVASRQKGAATEVWVSSSDAADGELLARRLHDRHEDRIEIHPSAGSVALVGHEVAGESQARDFLMQHLTAAGIGYEAVIPSPHAWVAMIPANAVDRAVALLHRAAIEQAFEEATSCAG